MLDVVVFLVSLGVRVIRAMCRRRADLVLENVALRQQVTALKKERVRSKYSCGFPLERCKLLTRWAFEYFDQTATHPC